MRLISILLFFAILNTALGQAVRVKASLDKPAALIGDQVVVSVSITHGRNVEVHGVDFSPLTMIEELELVREKSLNTINPKDKVLIQEAVITAFDSGYYKIPPLPVLFSINGKADTVYTNDLAFSVELVVISTDSIQIMPIKGISKEPVKPEDFYPYLLGLLALIALGALIYYLSRPKKKKEIKIVKAPPLPAHLIALEALEKLKSEQLWQNGKIKEYESRLTYILRQYLENRYSLRALESTTDEILKDLDRIGLGDKWNKKLGDLFQVADLVKFAKAKPSESIFESVFADAKAFVDETKLIEEKTEDVA